MAELNSKSESNTNIKVRAKKLVTKVDLTAMVDLAFLLITFFMLTTSLNKPEAMDIAMPDKDKTDITSVIDVADNRTVTLLLGANNQILWYYGLLDNPLLPSGAVDYGRNGIRQVLKKMKLEVPARAGGADLIVLIRPSDQSIMRNLVDVMDEIKILDIKRFMISTIHQDEVDVLKKKGLYSE